MKHGFSLIFSIVVGFGVSLSFLHGANTLLLAIQPADFSRTAISPIVVAAEKISNVFEEPKPLVSGLTMFRGNKERNFYGTGPIPSSPQVAWKYPDEKMCHESTSLGVTSEWCGSGWTGQPVVWERPDGVTEVIFGAYDGAIHFVNADTGKNTRPNFQTGDIIKGSFTLDTDGFPLLYGGSRDNKMRIIALDRDVPTELWALDADKLPGGIWNNDWDGNPVIDDGILYEGGENGIFYAVELNRSYGDDGKVTVDPEIIFQYKGYSDEWVERVDANLSIESSPLIVDNVVYVANSGGRIMGFDIKKIRRGNPEALVFDFWTGDDTDATLVSDTEGYIYAVVEQERFTDRSAELGQIIKLDPRAPDPLVWSIHLPSDPEGGSGGIWATPALYKNYLYVSTHLGELVVVNTHTGEIVWRETIGEHPWSSPAVVDDTLVVATCPGALRAYSLANPSNPELIWNKKVGNGCIEATPAIWRGEIFVGSRDGYFYKVK